MAAAVKRFTLQRALNGDGKALSTNPYDRIKVAQFPAIVDIMKLARSLEVQGNRKVAGAFRSAWRAQSCASDLLQSQAICDALDSVERHSASLDATSIWHIRSGLLASAVLLYARATATAGSGKERGAIQLDPKKLTTEQLEDHEMLVRLRNGAVGHVETDLKIGRDFWHRDFLFAKEVAPGSWQIASASTNIGFLFETFERLKRQLPVATALVREKARARLDVAIKFRSAARHRSADNVAPAPRKES